MCSGPGLHGLGLTDCINGWMDGWMAGPTLSPQRTSGTRWKRWCEKYSIQIPGELWKTTLRSKSCDAFMTSSRQWGMCYLTPIRPPTGLNVEENNKSDCLWIEFLSLVRRMVTFIGYRDIFAPDGHKFLTRPTNQPTTHPADRTGKKEWIGRPPAATRSETKQLLTGSRPGTPPTPAL